MTTKVNDGPEKRNDALRGFLAFVIGDALYYLSTQRNMYDPPEATESIKQKFIEDMKQGLLDTLKTMSFRGETPPQPTAVSQPETATSDAPSIPGTPIPQQAEPKTSFALSKAEKLTDGENIQLTVLFEEGWEIGHQQFAGDAGIIEFVRNGETVENWTELVTLFLRSSYRDIDLDLYVVEGVQKALRDRCRQNPRVAVISREDTDGLPSRVFTVECEAFANGQPESYVERVIAGHDALYSLQRTRHSASLDPDTVEQWSEFLRKVIHVCDTRDPSRPCPDLPSEEETKHSKGAKPNAVASKGAPRYIPNLHFNGSAAMQAHHITSMGLAVQVANTWLLGEAVKGEGQQTFSLKDGQVTWYCKFKKRPFSRKPVFRAVWYRPDGQVFQQEDFMVAFGNHELAKHGIKWDVSRPAGIVGTWHVQIYYKGDLLDDRAFEVMP